VWRSTELARDVVTALERPEIRGILSFTHAANSRRRV
jgi:hypothetical protein